MLKAVFRKDFPDFSLDVALTSREGVTALFGPSGSGKTMTLQCIAGLTTPDTGRIELDGRALFDSFMQIDVKPRQRSIGFVFHNYALFPHMTIFQNILFGIQHLPHQEAAARVEDIAIKMRIQHLLRRRPSEISAGQQQRTALARALITEPKLLLLDEPFSALDTLTKSHLESEFIELQRFYSGHVLFVTHNLEEAYRLSGLIAVYDAGRIAQIGPRREIIQRPATLNTALLTGVRNCWPAYIISQDEDSAMVQLTGCGIILTIAHHCAGLTPGMLVWAGIRTENTGISDHPGPNIIPAVITRITEGVSLNTAQASVFEDPDSSEPTFHAEVQFSPDRFPLQIGQDALIALPADRLFAIR